MTKAEQAKLRSLELENAELREWQATHLRVYGDMLAELVELRAQLQLLREIAGCAPTTGATPAA